MQYRKNNKTGEDISVLGYGCMRMPTKAGSIDVERAKSQILYAIDNGVNYLDTAWIYHRGASESFLGKHILKDGYREKVNIATKMPCFLVNKTSQFEDFFEKQRKRLNVQVIDYYLLHTLDKVTFEKMLSFGIIDFMNKLRRDGKIRYMGFSFHDKPETFAHIVDSYDWDFCQVQYNIIDENFQAGINGISYAKSKGLNVFVMEPLRGGMLVGRMPKSVANIYDKAEVVRKPADWALRWILNHEEVTMVLSGMNDEEHIKENIETVSTSLPNAMSESEKEIIDEVRKCYDEIVTVKCSGCRYCLPCPAGIDIPNAFKYLNDLNMFGSKITRINYIMGEGVRTADGKPHWTSLCINCGKCEKVCPQHLPIRSDLKKVGKRLEGVIPKTIAAFVRLFYHRKKK